MHTHNLDKWEHSHHFNVDNAAAEKSTWRVIGLTVVMMVVEIIAGFSYGSMALLADGWHMGTHAAALGITVFAYIYAKRHAEAKRFTFGTGKVGVLGGFTSAIVLSVVALLMLLESVHRIFVPQSIQFNEALVVAVIGLAVNSISAVMLQGEHTHKDKQECVHQHDHNLRAAYLHVLADATTSLLAIVALVVGKYLGWIWLDPLMGIIGGIVILIWAYGLLGDTSSILLDSAVDDTFMDDVRQMIEHDSDNRVIDLHVWQLGAHHVSAIISIITHYPKPVEYYKNLLKGIKGLHHISIEIHHCKEPPCV